MLPGMDAYQGRADIEHGIADLATVLDIVDFAAPVPRKKVFVAGFQ